MPHKAFDPVRNSLPVQFSKGCLNQLQCQRVELEATGGAGTPVGSQSGATGGALDDGDGCLGSLRNPSGKAEFRPDDPVHRLQGDPARGGQLFLPPDIVREPDLFLGLVQAGKRREAIDVCHF